MKQLQEKFEKIGDVLATEIVFLNGWYYPAFITKGGRYVPKMIPTGNCWVMNWELEKEQSK